MKTKNPVKPKMNRSAKPKLETSGKSESPTPKIPLGSILQRYFCEYLVSQRDLSQNTIASYRDTFRLLLEFLKHRYRIQPDDVCVDHLDAPHVLAFLEDLEQQRGNTVRSRNARRAAIRCFIRYAAAAEPQLLLVAQRVLAIPAKRFERASVSYLTQEQMQVILDAPDIATFSGRRDRILLLLLYNTGARTSELAGLQIQDVSLQSRVAVHIHGKGRKNRSVPLWQKTAKLLSSWLQEIHGDPDSPLLPNGRGHRLTRSGIAQRLQYAVQSAASKEPSLQSLRISPHLIRHTTAMHLLQSGVDLSVIAMWLGHESIQTTHQYLDADLESKKRALACLAPPGMGKSPRVRNDAIVEFLKGL
jgi:integrase/recombinase XerD